MTVNYQRLLRDLEQELLAENTRDPEFEEEIHPARAILGPLRSYHFADDPELQAVAQGRLRLGRPGDPPYPAPIQSQGPAVRKVQQALVDLGHPLPRYGVDGRYGQETYDTVLAYKQQFNIRNQSGYVDGIVGSKTVTHLDSNFPSEVDCSGWESDPQSFSKRAAERYLWNIWQPWFSVSHITCTAPPPNWICKVAVSTGAGDIILTVQLSPQDKLVRVSRDSDPAVHMVCFYSYHCLASGQLVLEGSATCPTF